MITWLQTAFLKHNKIIFGALMVVVVVTFVLYVGPQGFGGADRGMQVERRDFFGINMNNPADQQRMMLHSSISAQLNSELGINANSISQYAFARTAALGMANDLGMPDPAKTDLDKFVRNLQIFASEESGEFSARSYQDTMTALQQGFGVDEATIARVLREDYKVSKVLEVLGGPAFQLPFEARQNYADSQTSWNLSLARFAYDSFQPELEPDVETLQAFYNSNTFRYEVPERISATAVQFQSANFMFFVDEPANEELSTFFDRFSFRYQDAPQDEEGEEEAAPRTLEDEEIRMRVVNDWKNERAIRLAREASDGFLGRLWETKVARNSEAVNALIAEFNGVARELPPYPRRDNSFDPQVPQSTKQNAWIFIDGDRFYTDIGQTRDGAVVLLVNEVLPAAIPPFEEVRDQVANDWTAQERRRLFVEQGRFLREQLITAVSEGADFAETAESLGLTIETVPEFVGSDVPQLLGNSPVWSQVRNLRAGDITEMVTEADKGTFAFVVAKDRPEIDFSAEQVQAEIESTAALQRTSAGWMVVSEIANARLQSFENLMN